MKNKLIEDVVEELEEMLGSVCGSRCGQPSHIHESTCKRDFLIATLTSLVQQSKKESVRNFEKEYHKAHSDGREEEREMLAKKLKRLKKTDWTYGGWTHQIDDILASLSNTPKT